jgi:hypothetical protein
MRLFNRLLCGIPPGGVRGSLFRRIHHVPLKHPAYKDYWMVQVRLGEGNRAPVRRLSDLCPPSTGTYARRNQ